jgi:hypothetical protein
MQVLRWVWPLNWWLTIKQLRAENLALRAANIELQNKLVALHMQNAMAASSYLSSLTSLMGSINSRKHHGN